MNAFTAGSGMPPVPSIPNQYMNGPGMPAQPPRLGVNAVYGSGQGAYPVDPTRGPLKTDQIPMDVPTLIATKGYNPVAFDCTPPDVR